MAIPSTILMTENKWGKKKLIIQNVTIGSSANFVLSKQNFYSCSSMFGKDEAHVSWIALGLWKAQCQV